MKYVLTFILFVLFSIRFYGQDEPELSILFQGIVMDSKTFEPLPESQLTVKRKFIYATDKDGTFAVYVNVSDTLVFSRIGYKSQNVIISDSLLGKRQYIAGIFMNTDTIDIGEVIIMPRMENLRYDMMNAPTTLSPEMENARYNVAISAYQGRTTTGTLGDPASNYELLRQQQKTNAFEKGGIPSDKIAGFNPLILIPAAYMLIHGLPEKPEPMKPTISAYERDQLTRAFLASKNKTSLYRK
jgi:hypothetical protein